MAKYIRSVFGIQAGCWEKLACTWVHFVDATACTSCCSKCTLVQLNLSVPPTVLHVCAHAACRTEVDPNYVKNEKGDYEIVINTTACDTQGEPGSTIYRHCSAGQYRCSTMHHRGAGGTSMVSRQQDLSIRGFNYCMQNNWKLVH